MTIWVATRNGTVRHPVNNGLSRAGKDGEGPKALHCRPDSPTWVHECTEDEIEQLRECWKCKKVLREEAVSEAAAQQAMRET